MSTLLLSYCKWSKHSVKPPCTQLRRQTGTQQGHAPELPLQGHLDQGPPQPARTHGAEKQVTCRSPGGHKSEMNLNTTQRNFEGFHKYHQISIL